MAFPIKNINVVFLFGRGGTVDMALGRNPGAIRHCNWAFRLIICATRATVHAALKIYISSLLCTNPHPLVKLGSSRSVWWQLPIIVGIPINTRNRDFDVFA
jgi:hypothetical protein